jgi:hypothetical protein
MQDQTSQLMLRLDAGPDGHVYTWGNDPPDDTLAN